MDLIRKEFAALVIALFAASAFALAPLLCEAKAVTKDGKPLVGVANSSSHEKCQADIKAACDTKAISERVRKLSGAAKSFFMKKCEAEAG